MKEASCCDGKMVAYCDEVQKLEERFIGLELHHILKWDNLATDSLAKIASSRGPVPRECSLMTHKNHGCELVNCMTK